MSKSQLIRTIDDACDFILEWMGIGHDLPAETHSGKIAIPEPVIRLNSRFGQLWRDSNHSLMSEPDEADYARSLFESQDQFANPLDYEDDEEGIVTLLSENQGVWAFGFRPMSPEGLFVSGDWIDGLSSEFPKSWRQVNATPEDALIFGLLGNFAIMISSPEDWEKEEYEKPVDANVLLWAHPAWKGFGGFWTSSDQDLIYYSGMHLVVRR